MNQKGLNMNKKLIIGIIMLMMFITVTNMASPIVSYALTTVNTADATSENMQDETTSGVNGDDVNAENKEDDTEKLKKKKTKKEKTTIGLKGVKRASNLETNKKIFSDQIMSIGKIILGFIIFVIVIGIGITTITDSNDTKNRVAVMEKFKHIIYGVILFGAATLIVSLAYQFQQKILTDLYGQAYENADFDDLFDEEPEEEANWLSDIFEIGLKSITTCLEYLIKIAFAIIGFNRDGIIQSVKGAGPYDFNNILFLSGFGNILDFEKVNAAGMKLTTAPFTVRSFKRYTTAYFLLTSVSVPLMLIALIKSAYELALGAGNYEKVTEVKKTTLRICLGIVIVAFGPYLFRTILTFFNMLVYLIPVEFSFDIVVESIKDASGLLSIISILWWSWIKFRIMLLFVVREIMLTVMYIATPVVVGFWAVSEKTKIFNRWIGEIVTNAATQFCYAMVFFIATVVLHGVQANVFFTLLWLSLMLKLANFFKESFQGLFDKWGGVDEASLADSFASKVTSYGTTAAASVMNTYDEQRVYAPSRFLTNVMAFTHAVKTGDTGKFVTKSLQDYKFAKKLRVEGVDDLKTANAIELSYIHELKNDAVANSLHHSLRGYRSSFDQDVRKLYMDEAQRIVAENPSNALFADIIQAHNLFEAAAGKRRRASELEKVTKAAFKKDGIGGIKVWAEGRKENQLLDKYGIPKDGEEIINSRNGKNRLFKMSITGADPNFNLADLVNASQGGASNAGSVNNQNQNIFNVMPTKKLGGMTSPGMNKEILREKIIEKAEQEGLPTPVINNETLTQEANNIASYINSQINNAKKSIDVQKEGNSRALTEDVKKDHMRNTNKSVEDCVHSISKLYEDGLFMSNDKKMASKLDGLVNEVEYNGDYTLAKTLRQRIRNIGPLAEDDSKL